VPAQKFEVRGQFRNGAAWQPYTKVITALNEKHAAETTYATIGSKHCLKRNYITIKEVTLIDGE